jgi:hypothetical protein
MFWLLLVVCLLAWSGVIGYRRRAAKKNLERIQTSMQGRIRLAFGKEVIVSDIDTRHAVPQARREPLVFAARRAAEVISGVQAA